MHVQKDRLHRFTYMYYMHSTSMLKLITMMLLVPAVTQDRGSQRLACLHIAESKPQYTYIETWLGRYSSEIGR